jgi:hypothetical protein
MLQYFWQNTVSVIFIVQNHFIRGNTLKTAVIITNTHIQNEVKKERQKEMKTNNK